MQSSIQNNYGTEWDWDIWIQSVESTNSKRNNTPILDKGIFRGKKWKAFVPTTNGLKNHSIKIALSFDLLSGPIRIPVFVKYISLERQRILEQGFMFPFSNHPSLGETTVVLHSQYHRQPPWSSLQLLEMNSRCLSSLLSWFHQHSNLEVQKFCFEDSGRVNQVSLRMRFEQTQLQSSRHQILSELGQWPTDIQKKPSAVRQRR